MGNSPSQDGQHGGRPHSPQHGLHLHKSHHHQHQNDNKLTEGITENKQSVRNDVNDISSPLDPVSLQDLAGSTASPKISGSNDESQLRDTRIEPSLSNNSNEEAFSHVEDVSNPSGSLTNPDTAPNVDDTAKSLSDLTSTLNSTTIDDTKNFPATTTTTTTPKSLNPTSPSPSSLSDQQQQAQPQQGQQPNQRQVASGSGSHPNNHQQRSHMDHTVSKMASSSDQQENRPAPLRRKSTLLLEGENEPDIDEDMDFNKLNIATGEPVGKPLSRAGSGDEIQLGDEEAARKYISMLYSTNWQ